ncbi:MAG: beta-lactamase family protein [Parachlamydiaceae bacterium]|nr:beta-lactamase family protein [Parachlamydiaceae bacterium]
MNYQFSWKSDSTHDHQVAFNPKSKNPSGAENTVSINGHAYTLSGTKEDISFIIHALSQKNFQSLNDFQKALEGLERNPLVSNHNIHIYRETGLSTKKIAEASSLPRLKTEDALPQEFKDYFKQLSKHQAISGVISVSWGDREPMTIVAIENVSQTPFTADTPFNIMSAGKAFTSAAIIQLVEKNISIDDIKKFTLNTPLVDIGLSTEDYHLYGADEKYLYDLCPNSDFRTVVDQAIEAFRANPNITIRHLLQHQSGLIDDKDVKGLRFDKEMIDHYKYSNYGYQILARVITKMSKVPFQDFIKINIIEKSGAEGSASRTGKEPTPHDCVLGKLEKKIGPENVIKVPDADGNGCWWMTAGNLEKVARSFAQGDLFANKENLSILKIPLITNVKDGFTLEEGAGIKLAPDPKKNKDSNKQAIVFQGTHEGRSAVAVVIQGGKETLSIGGVFNCMDGSNCWADIVEIYRGTSITMPLEKYAHFSLRLKACDELYKELSETPPKQIDAMKDLLKKFAVHGIAPEYKAISLKLEKTGQELQKATADLMRKADWELQNQKT